MIAHRALFVRWLYFSFFTGMVCALTPMPGPDGWSSLPAAQYQVVYDREVIITEPPDSAVAGVLLAFHGCLQSVTQFGFASPACPTCHGTPEVMTLVYKAVRRGYAVVAMGAHRGGDKWRCYDTQWPPEEHHEISGIIKVVRHILLEKGWWQLPRYAFGSSSGGCIALELALRFPLQGVASMLMGFHLSTLDDLNPRNPYTDEHWAYPPTFILRTLLDEPDVIVRVNSTAAALNALGAHVELATLQPYKLSPSFFSDRMRGVSTEMSADIYSRLQGIDVIDTEGYCQWKKCDVPHSCWDPMYHALKSTLWDLFPAWEDMAVDAAFREMLWASRAVHETTSEHTDEMLDFLEQQSKHLQIHPAEHPSGLYDAHAALKPARAPAPASAPRQPASMATRGPASPSATPGVPLGALQQGPAAVSDISAAPGGSSAQSAGSAEPVRHAAADAASGGRSLKDQAELLQDNTPSSSAEGRGKQRKRSLQI